MSNNEAEKIVFTLFGASGDLAKLKVYPSFFELYKKSLLPDDFWIIGFARSLEDDESHRKDVKEAIETSKYYKTEDEAVLEAFLGKVYTHKGAYDTAESLERYRAKRNEVTKGEYDQEIGYLSVPPSVYAGIIGVFKEKDNEKYAKQKIVLEKPFGIDEKSANELQKHLLEYFDEEKIYLLDHYLGKKPVQDILPLRKEQKMLEKAIIEGNIEKIEVNALESLGVEERLGFFDQTGTLKDMIQSHLLQIVALLLLNQHTNPQKAKTEVLERLKVPQEDEKIVYGQYAGYCASSEKVCNPFTPTFVAIELIYKHFNKDIPIYLRSGKCLAKKETYVAICLKNKEETEKIVIEMSPKQQMRICKQSGEVERCESKSLVCETGCLGEHGGLIKAIMEGKKEHFLRFDEVLACWHIIDQISEKMKGKRPEMYEKAGTGPKKAERLTSWTTL